MSERVKKKERKRRTR